MESMPDSGQKLPFLMEELFEEAKKEAESIRKKWPELREKLKYIEPYANLYTKI